MTVTAREIPLGAIVYARDGKRFGRVWDVWANTPDSGYVQLSHYLTESFGPMRASNRPFGTVDAFVQIGDCLLDNPAGFLFVPIVEVVSIRAGTGIVLGLSTATCLEVYSDRPTELEIEPARRRPPGSPVFSDG